MITNECKHWACNRSTNTCVGCGKSICPVCLLESDHCECDNKDECCSVN